MIIFYYEIPKLINRAEVDILLYLKKVENEEGLPDFEESSAGTEDEALLKKILKDISNEVYGTLSPYSRGLADLDTPLEGFEFDETFTDDEDNSTENCIIFRILKPTYWDETMQSPLDNAIENVLINYTVKEWLKKNNVKDYETYQKLYEKAKDGILNYLNRRTKIRRTYKLY